MKKSNKKLLVLAILLLVVCAGVGTFAIYRSTSSGTTTATTAQWAVKVNGTNMETGSFTFGASDITWTTNTSKVSGKIAPGSTGTITLEIDATGLEVDVDYTAAIESVKIDGTTVSNSAFTVTPATTTDGAGTIAYNATSMKKTITLNVVWTGADSDTTEKDTADKAMAGKDIEIKLNVTAKQHLGA